MKNIIKYNNIEYFMPFLFCNDIFIPILHRLLENEINPVKYVYGSPYCKWGTGARPAIFNFNNLNFIEKYFEKLKNKYNLIPALTFTNLNSHETLNDEYSNNLLDIAYSFDCRFIISTDELYNHIKKRYPEAKMHCSILQPMTKFVEEKNFDETKFYNEMLNKYEVVVIRPEYIIENINNLNTLLSDTSRTEVLINQNCHFNCPHHRAHYNFLAEIDEIRGDKEEIKKVKYWTDTKCGHEHFSLCPKYTSDYRTVHLTNEQVYKVIDSGITKLKIQGRSLTFNMLFEELYQNFFNNEYSKEELRSKTDKLCAEMIENDKKTALFLN